MILLVSVVKFGVLVLSREGYVEDFFSAVVYHLLDRVEGDPHLSLASDLQALGGCYQSQTRPRTTSFSVMCLSMRPKCILEAKICMKLIR